MSGIFTASRTAGLREIVSLSPQSITHASGGVLPATAGYGVYADGNAKQIVGASVTTLEAWINIASKASSYEVRATIVSGTVSTGTTGSWLALSSDQIWTRTSSAGSTNTTVLTVDIRKVSTGTVVATASITLVADAT